MVNEAFDREFLRLLELGDVDALLQFSTNHVHEAGNGAEEIRMWITAMGIAGAGRYETYFYRAVPNWFTGIGIGEWKL